MATLDLSNLLQPINLSDPNAVDFGSFVASAPTLWRWVSSAGHLIDVVASGMTFDALGHATGGTATAIGFDVGNNGPSLTEIQITGFSINAKLLDNNAASFWRILEGDDTIIGAPVTATPGGADAVSFFGDNILARPSVAAGGNDTIFTGRAKANVSGDVFDVGARTTTSPAVTYRGGDDSITIEASTYPQTVVGDAMSVNATGKLIGGDDAITVLFSTVGTLVYGDAQVVGGISGDPAIFRGGNDIIDASAISTDVLTIEGDIGSLLGFAAFRGGNDRLTGGDGRDTIVGDVHNQSSDIIGGNDVIFGGGGDDSLIGDVHNAASATTRCGNDVIHGGDGNDNIFGDTANTSPSAILIGGRDRLFGDAGNDAIFGGNANDFMDGGAGADRLDGGDGLDTASYASAAAGVRADLLTPGANTGGALGDTYIDVEALNGSKFDDTLRGDASDNRLQGKNGADFLVGSGGNDRLFGGLDNDKLSGGNGDDQFFFNTALNSVNNRDLIVDFVAADDAILLSHNIFSNLGQTSGVLASGAFFASATGLAHDASDRIIYNTTTGVLTYDENGNGLGGGVEFAVLAGAPLITSNDFLVF